MWDSRRTMSHYWSMILNELLEIFLCIFCDNIYQVRTFTTWRKYVRICWGDTWEKRHSMIPGKMGSRTNTRIPNTSETYALNAHMVSYFTQPHAPLINTHTPLTHTHTPTPTQTHTPTPLTHTPTHTHQHLSHTSDNTRILYEMCEVESARLEILGQKRWDLDGIKLCIIKWEHLKVLEISFKDMCNCAYMFIYL